MKIFYSKTSFNYLVTLDRKTKTRIVKAVDKLPDKGDVVRLHGKKIKKPFSVKSRKVQSHIYY